MNIEEIFKTLEIPQIKGKLNQSRQKLERLSIEIYDLESTKRDKELKLKFRETDLEVEIFHEIENGKRKFTNDGLRKAEFIIRSSEDAEINTLRDDILSFIRILSKKKLDLDVESKYYEELLLDYKLAISLVNHLK